jgi:integrase
MDQFSFDFTDPVAISNATETVQPQSGIDCQLAVQAKPALPSNIAATVPETTRAWSGGAPSFADALDFVDTTPGLSKTAQRDLRSALVSAAKILGRQPRDIEFNIAAISNSTLTHVPKLFECKVQRRRNILSGLRKAAKLMGLIPATKIGSPGLTPEWAAFWDSLGADFAKHRLTRLARFCGNHGIRPQEVTSTVFFDFATELASVAIIGNQATYLWKATSIWNQLVSLKPELKLQTIKEARKRVPLTVPPNQFTAEFRSELDRFRATLNPVDIGALHDDLELPVGQAPFRPNQPLKPTTVNLRLDQLGYAAGALVQSGHSPQSIKSLNDLFTPIGNVKTIVRHLRERGSGQRSSYIAGVIEALRQAARFCEANPETQAELARLKAVVNPKENGVVARNRDRLRAMIEPETRAIIVALPQLLLDSARQSDDLLNAARLVRTAVALELLIIAAPRLDNLNRLDIENSFRRAASGKRKITHMIVDALDVKNGVAIERRLPAGTVKLVQLWLDKYRPLLAKPAYNWLFPGDAEKPLNKGQLRKWITRAIRDFANVDVHPHLFRHFCAWLHLQYHPGDYEGVRRILGHKRIETSIKSYIAFEQDIAAARFDEVVLMERRTTKVMAKQALKIRLCFDNKNTGKSRRDAQNG